MAFVFLFAMLPTAMAQRVNLAKYQPVTSSSQSGTYTADFVTDGIVSNFHCLRTPNITNFFLGVEITFPYPVTVASAHTYLGLVDGATPTEVLTAFRYQRHDGAAWVEIPGSSVTSNTATEVAVTFTQAVTATRFRLVSGNNGVRTLREIALFPPNVVGNVEQGYPIGTDVNLNLAFKRPATASSAQIVNPNGAGYAKNAFDGYLDNRSRWLVNPVSGSTYASGEWIEIDLLSSHTVGHAHIHSGVMDANRVNSSPIPNFELQYLSGTDWLPIPGATITGNTLSARNIDFSTPVSAQRIRLITTSATPARLQELLLFPPRAGGYTLGAETINAAPPTDTWDRYSDSYYRIRNAGPDLRIGLVNGAVVHVPADANFPMRTEWQLLLNYRDGTYRVRNADTGLCLALASLTTASGTAVVAEEYDGLPHQDWRMVYSTTTPTQFSLVNAYSGLAIQPQGSSWTSGTPLVVVTPSSTIVQLWTASLRRHYPKKGIAGTGNMIRTSTTPYVTSGDLTFHEDFYNRFGQSSWSYSWGRQVSISFPYLDKDHAFSPMNWGNGPWGHGTDATRPPIERNHRDLHANGKPVYVLGFNEPDREDQGNLSAADALTRWPRLEARDMPLVSPVPANALSTWNDAFVPAANDLGYRRDYTAVHWYAAPDGDGGADGLINHLQDVNTQLGRPVWLTEFSTVRWSGTSTWTDADNFNFLAEFMWRAEALTWLKRYSLFNYIEGGSPTGPDPADAPRSNAIRADGSLTALGQLYAGWDGVTSIVTEKAYHLHNHQGYRRARNAGGTSAPASVDAESGLDGVQWTLLPGITASTFRILSTLDGRPLRTTDGTSVSFGTPGQTGTAVEWSLVSDEHGRYYIQHPASANKRLSLTSGGAWSLSASTSTSGLAKWRIVRPAASEPAALPATPSGLTATAAAASISLTWSAAAGATAYTIERLDTLSSTWQSVANGITQTTWIQTGLAGATSYTYRILASNVIGTSAVSTTASATTPHALSSQTAWVAEYLSALPLAQQAPGADPDRDSIPNLLEYAYASQPNQSSASLFQIQPPAAGALTLSFPWNWRATDLTWQVRSGTDLTTSSSWPVVTPTSTQTTRSGNIDQLQLTLPTSGNERRFYLLEVISN